MIKEIVSKKKVKNSVVVEAITDRGQKIKFSYPEKATDDEIYRIARHYDSKIDYKDILKTQLQAYKQFLRSKKLSKEEFDRKLKEFKQEKRNEIKRNKENSRKEIELLKREIRKRK